MPQQGRILTDDLTLYDNEHIVFQPVQLSAQRLQELLHLAWRETYRFDATCAVR